MNAPAVDTTITPNLTVRYEIILTDSIKIFMAELQSGVSNFSAFQSLVGRVLQKMADPPFEFLCFYLAISYHNSLSMSNGPFFVAKELFQLVPLLSTPCNALKRVAVLAPVIYVLHKSFICSSKADVFLRRQIENLLERIVNYVSMCCSLEEQSNGIEIDKLSYCFMDMMRVWTVGQVEGGCKLVDDLMLFFPLISDEVRMQISVGYSMDYIAGVVMTEILILMLQLKLGSGACGVNLQRDMGAWVVQTIKQFNNFISYDMLLRMMLEPSLPVTNLLSSDEDILLRRVLYDAVLLGQLPFLKSGKFSQLHESQLKNMFLVWLLVADSAIDFTREYGEALHATAISYIEAFSRSDIPNMLLELLSNQIGMKEKLSRPNAPTPKALIKWLLALQDQGIRIFEDCSTLHAKATSCNSRQDYVLPKFKSDTFLDLNGANKVCVDQEMVHYLNSPISTVACAVNPTATHGRRKRDEEMNEEEPRAKIVKWNFHNSPVTGISLPLGNDTSANGLCTGVEMKKTTLDDGDEEMKDVE